MPRSRPNFATSSGSLRPPALIPWTLASPARRGIFEAALGLGVDARALGERRQAHLVEQLAEIRRRHAEAEIDQLALQVHRPLRGRRRARDRHGQTVGLHPVRRQQRAAVDLHLARQAVRLRAGELQIDAAQAGRLVRQVGARVDASLQLARRHRPQLGRDVALGVEVGERQVRVQRQRVDVQLGAQAHLAAAGRAEAEVLHVDLAGAGVEREVEADAERAIGVELGVEALERRLHLQRGERVGEIGADGRVVAGDREAFDLQAAARDDGGQRVARLRELGVQLDAWHRRFAVDAGEEALAHQLGAAGVRLGQVEEDVVRPFRGGGDARDVDAIERQHEIVQDAQPAAARRQHRARRRSRRSGAAGSVPSCFSDARACACRSSRPPRAREVEDRVQVAELRAGDLEERPRPLLGLGAGRGRGRLVLGRERGEEPDPLAVLHRGEPPQRDRARADRGWRSCRRRPACAA